MNFYRQPILLFGLILPLVVAILLTGGGFLLKSSIEESYHEKLVLFRSSERSRLATKEVESQVIKQHQYLDQWNKLLSQETASVLTTNLREICDHLPSKEIQQTAFDRANGRTGLGSVTAQNSSELRIAFRGTYRTMQKAFLELETRMPQLQLQDMRIESNNGQSTLLNFQVTYTAWEN
jgi:hypothetical protein